MKTRVFAPAQIPNALAALALQTRRFGHCYVPAQLRGRHEFGAIVFDASGFGRSLESGGNKYKVHAWDKTTRKPVPSVVLRDGNPAR